MDAETTQREGPELVVVRRSGRGWQVGPEETADLTSAMVLADLLAGDLGSPTAPPSGPLVAPPDEAGEAARLAVTVAQLEHALS
ncbi:MAG TPA: hypothetical protein VJ371_19840, partial [Streptosporangiaceae bacterium]|nr:hypothetical protein [Streptosporangiaceae bacterium]